MFVLTHDNRLYAAPKVRGVRHHTSFSSGADVKAAGMFEVVDGFIKVIIARSGHYLPSEKEMLLCVEYLLSLGVQLTGTMIWYQLRLNDEPTVVGTLNPQSTSNLWLELFSKLQK